jgi:hypothetical protein
MPTSKRRLRRRLIEPALQMLEKLPLESVAAYFVHMVQRADHLELITEEDRGRLEGLLKQDPSVRLRRAA